MARQIHHQNLPAVVAGDLRSDPPFLVLASPGIVPMPIPAQPLPLRHALWRGRQLAAALTALHDSGWIHARMSPESVLISPRGHVILHELGWSRRGGTAECRGDQLLAADLRYVAPEMLSEGSILTPACDLYCLGLLLVEMLVGRPAVDAASGWQAALAQLRGEIPSVGELRPDVPGSLLRLIARLTSREPLRRPCATEAYLQLVRQEVKYLGGASSGRTRWR